MDEQYLIKVQSALARALDPATLMRLARSSGFCQRMRSVSPHEVVVALVAAMATRTTETIADVVRVFNTVTEHRMAYKPFHNKLAKSQFPEFMRLVVCHLLDELVGEALRPTSRSALSMFDDILLQDGTSFAIADKLQDALTVCLRRTRHDKLHRSICCAYCLAPNIILFSCRRHRRCRGAGSFCRDLASRGQQQARAMDARWWRAHRQ